MYIITDILVRLRYTFDYILMIIISYSNRLSCRDGLSRSGKVSFLKGTIRTIIVTRPENNIRIRLFIEIATTTMSLFGLGVTRYVTFYVTRHRRRLRTRSRRGPSVRAGGFTDVVYTAESADGGALFLAYLFQRTVMLFGTFTGQRGWGFELGRFCLRYYETSLWASPTTTRIVLLDNNTQIERVRTQLCRAVKLSGEKKNPHHQTSAKSYSNIYLFFSKHIIYKRWLGARGKRV